jgi:hypothetical protein
VLWATWISNQHNNMTAPWQNTFRAFAGPGIDHPSDSLRVSEDEAAEIIAQLATSAWAAARPLGPERHRQYTIADARTGCVTALFGADGIVGFYAGSYLWIASAHRRRGLAIPLILAAAEQRGGTVVPPGVVAQGFSPTGLLAHRAAHRQAVLTALAAGRPVPPAVIAEYLGDCHDRAAA